MIEKVILDYLKEKLNSVPVALVRSDLQDGEFVLFEKIGSKEVNYINSATFAFQSYSDTLYGAAFLNQRVVEVVKSMVILNNIASVKFETDYNFTDTSTKKYRYQAIFDFIYY